jgi:hypothetical protein
MRRSEFETEHKKYKEFFDNNPDCNDGVECHICKVIVPREETWRFDFPYCIRCYLEYSKKYAPKFYQTLIERFPDEYEKYV